MDLDEAVRFVAERFFDYFYTYDISRPKMILNAEKTKGGNIEVNGFVIIDGILFYLTAFFDLKRKQVLLVLENGDNRITKRVEL